MNYVRHKLSWRQYSMLFGSLFDKDERCAKQFVPWKIQGDMMDKVDRDVKLRGINTHWFPKARQLGMTESAAERMIKGCIGMEKAQGLVISKIEDDATYLMNERIVPKLKYIDDKFRELKALGRIPKDFEHITWNQPRQGRIDFSNGSSITVLPSSNTSGASMTADFIICDEAGGFDLQPNGNFESFYGRLLPVLEKSGMNGWIMVIGTSEPDSFFNQKVRELWDRLDNIRAGLDDGEDLDEMLYFLPWWTDEARDHAWNRKMRKKLGDVMFKTQFPANKDDFFSRREGKIFPQYDSRVGGHHLMNLKVNLHGDFWHVYDHGMTKEHPGAWLWGTFDKHTGVIQVCGEKYWYEGEAVYIRADYINFILNRLPRQRFTYQLADTSIFNKLGTDETVSIAENFETHGIYFNKSNKYDENSAITLMQDALLHKKIQIGTECVDLNYEMENYRWDKNGKKPQDKNNNGVDCLKYFTVEVFRNNRGLGGGVEVKARRDPPERVGRKNQMLWKPISKTKLENVGPGQAPYQYQVM